MSKLLSLSGSNAKLTVFEPEKWGEVRKFSEFYRGTHALNRRAQAAVRGVQSHFRRAESLLALFNSHTALVQQDYEQEKKSGYSLNSGGERLAVLVESFACELYSSVDCTNQVIRSVLTKAQGIADRTSGTFKNAKSGKLSADIPDLIKAAFATADWYEELRSIRTTATHSETGMCRLNRENGCIEYYVNYDFHSGFSLHFDDIAGKVDYFFKAVNQFHGHVFRGLNTTLKDDEQHVICMIANGRFFHRWVRPSEAKTIHAGRCESFSWFEAEKNLECPRAKDCEAYRTAKKANQS